MENENDYRTEEFRKLEARARQAIGEGVISAQNAQTRTGPRHCLPINEGGALGGLSGVTPKQAPVFTAMTRSNELAEVLCARVGGLAQRLLGPQPENPARQSGEDPREGLLGSLHDQAEYRIEKLETALNQLSAIEKELP